MMAWAGLVFWGAAVLGQTATVSALYVGGDSARPRLNAATCGATTAVDVQYTLTVSAAAGVTPVAVLYTQDVSIPAATTTSTSAASSSPVSCGDPSSDKILTGCSQGTCDGIALQSGSVSLLLSSLRPTTVQGLVSDLCGSATGVRVRRAICLAVRNGTGGNILARGGDGPDMDTLVPGAPLNLSLQAGDSLILATVDPPSGTDAVEQAGMTFVAEYRPCEPPDAGSAADGGSDAGGQDAAATDPCGAFSSTAAQDSPVEVDTLTNGTGYEVRVFAVDDFGNAGSPTASAFATPVEEYGFLDLYARPIYGVSCMQGQAGVWLSGVVLGAGAAVMRRRRRRGE
jgi:hypothetical protein